MNKSDLIDAIAESADVSKASAGRALDATIEAVKKAMKKGDMVTLVGFGTFYVSKRADIEVVQFKTESMSVIVKLITALVSSFTVASGITEITGGSS